jgi:carbon starvation protein
MGVQLLKATYLMAISFFAFWLGWRIYSRYLAEHVFKLDPNFRTPAHEFEDGTDYVPTNKHILWGHHFTSVAGTGPIVGPTIALFWGWVPALIYVVVGTIFLSGVHDFGTLWLSVRNKGKSVGTLVQDLIGPRARTLFQMVIFFLLILVNAVFGMIIANLFIAFPGSVLPVWIEVPIAMAVGYYVYKKRGGLLLPSIAGLLTLYFFVFIGNQFPIAFPKEGLWGVHPRILWIVILFVYCAVASTLPVWRLLQPRDFINSHQLFVGLGIVFLGAILINPEVVAPAFRTDVPAGSPSMVPILFVTIACGAISGFHGLVSSGTSAKQLNKEPDARPVGYLGSIGEGCLAVASIVAVAAANYASPEAWGKAFATWGAASGGAQTYWVQGIAKLATGVGLPLQIAQVFAAVLVVSFAATTLDSSFRLQRYIVTEMAQTYNFRPLQNGVNATILCVLIALALAIGADPKGGTGALKLWPVFGASNQLLAALSLLALTIFLAKLGRNYWVSFIPMLFLGVMISWGMWITMMSFFKNSQWLLFGTAFTIFALAVWLALEGLHSLRTKIQAAPAAAGD